MTYSDLILWIEQQFPGADYNVQVSTINKRHGVGKVTRWDCFVWPKNRTLYVDGYTADQVKAALEARLEAPKIIDLSRVDPEKVSA